MWETPGSSVLLITTIGVGDIVTGEVFKVDVALNISSMLADCVMVMGSGSTVVALVSICGNGVIIDILG